MVCLQARSGAARKSDVKIGSLKGKVTAMRLVLFSISVLLIGTALVMGWFASMGLWEPTNRDLWSFMFFVLCGCTLAVIARPDD